MFENLPSTRPGQQLLLISIRCNMLWLWPWFLQYFEIQVSIVFHFKKAAYPFGCKRWLCFTSTMYLLWKHVTPTFSEQAWTKYSHPLGLFAPLFWKSFEFFNENWCWYSCLNYNLILLHKLESDLCWLMLVVPCYCVLTMGKIRNKCIWLLRILL